MHESPHATVTEQLLRAHEALRVHKRLRDRGEWTPAADETLLHAIGIPYAFPFESVPPAEEFRENCHWYQERHPEFERGAPVRDDSDAVQHEAILAMATFIARRRGHDLCWEYEELYGLLPEYHDQVLKKGSLDECMRQCALYRECLEHALVSKEGKPHNSP